VNIDYEEVLRMEAIFPLEITVRESLESNQNVADFIGDDDVIAHYEEPHHGSLGSG